MNISFIVNLAKRVFPPDLYQMMKRYYELMSPCRLLHSLPYGLMLKYQYPRMLTISLTTKCNLRCLICRREGFKGEDLIFENLYKLKNAIKYACNINLTGWGESLLYPKFEDVLNYIYSLNAKKNLINLTTNGTKLTPHIAELLNGHLKTLTVSINAATAETYNRDMKNGEFHKTLTAIRSFIAALKNEERSKVVLYFVAHTENFREIPEFVSLAHHLGVSTVTVGHYLVGTTSHSQYSLLNVKQEYNSVVKQAQILGKKLGVIVNVRRRFFSEKSRSTRECLSPFRECIVEINGDLIPCCFCGTYRIGNVYEQGFEEVWFSEAYRKFRKERVIPACKNCTPFIPLDAYDAHFTSTFKETPAFREMERNIITRREQDL